MSSQRIPGEPEGTHQAGALRDELAQSLGNDAGALQTRSADPGPARCLIDAAGRIVAADETIAAWLRMTGSTWSSNGVAQIAEIIPSFVVGAVERPGPGVKTVRLATTLAVALSESIGGDVRVVLECRWMSGRDGPLVLIEFCRPAAVAEARREASRIDPVTGLPDRAALSAWHAARHRYAQTSPAPFALLFLDLDGFKGINDNYGHATGDRLLAELADRWRNALRGSDLICRYGGDEFVVVLDAVADEREAAPIVERLLAATRAPMTVGEATIALDASIGVVCGGAADAVEQLDDLIATADRRMYAAKRARQS